LFVFDDGKIGEPEEPIDAWYKEIDNYDFKHAVSKQGDPVGMPLKSNLNQNFLGTSES